MPTILCFLLIAIAVFLVCGRGHKPRKLPPGPCPLPILGNLFQLGGEKLYHRAVTKLSKVYGPLMSIKLGNQMIFVVSSPNLVREISKKYDHTFTRRLDLDASRALDHHKFSIAWIPSGKKWNNIRKLFKEQIFSSERLNASQGLREEKVKQLCDHVHEHSISGQPLNVCAAAFTTSLNFLSNTLFSIDFAHYDSNSCKYLEEIICGLTNTMGRPNLADFFPGLRFMDPQGIRHETEVYFVKLFEAFEDIITERLQARGTSPTSGSGKSDLLEVFLDLCQHREAGWSCNDVKHFLLDLFFGATDTTSSTVEWAMVELLRSPDKKEKARAEIREVIEQGKSVKESDISRLPYLQAVVKETLRLHPPAPIVPRKADTDIEVDSYILPKDSLIVFNLWGMGRDSNLWLNPDSFVPERFLNSEIDDKGQHFKLTPFGTGRRICVGYPLAQRMLHLMLASLVHNFDWKLEEGIKPEDVDMSERPGLTVQKAVPLMAIPIRTSI
ncbi:cytochrome P450 76C3-like [Coffea eugenioides]|uniref:cytochrome P450 76C3-like n=1 Tax=Coffea eugenioides TaxID=49369 RepID=UPI000F60D14B|nr:cytochrome P450 76C3-like [Coffea eugenioides]